MFDLLTRNKKDKDSMLTYEDLVIAKVSLSFLDCCISLLIWLHSFWIKSLFICQAIYEKGTPDEIEEFIHQLCDINGDGIVGR